MRTLFISLFVFLGLFFTFLSPAITTAQPVDVFSGVCQGDADKSSVCKEAKNTENPLFGPNGALTFAIKFMSILVAVAAVIMLILAGLKLITSGNNPQEVSKAREMIIYAMAGIVIAFMAQIIVQVFLNKVGA